MDELVRWTIPIAADNHKTLTPGIHYAGVTFDDGFLSTFENAVPELVERRIPATIFVVANLLGTTPKWATFGPQYGAQERIVTLERLTDWPTDLITIGSHTMTHPWLPSLREAEARNELSASRDKLRALLSRDITLFSFPYGALNERLVDLCREVGYERVFTIMPTLAFSDPKEFITGRVAVEPTDWRLEFRLKLLGAYQWLPTILRWKEKFRWTSTPESSVILKD
jgi:peptidoglycan/xylan/chitin deacetylase (PgdA/CDA1 family)